MKAKERVALIAQTIRDFFLGKKRKQPGGESGAGRMVVSEPDDHQSSTSTSKSEQVTGISKEDQEAIDAVLAEAMEEGYTAPVRFSASYDDLKYENDLKAALKLSKKSVNSQQAASPEQSPTTWEKSSDILNNMESVNSNLVKMFEANGAVNLAVVNKELLGKISNALTQLYLAIDPKAEAHAFDGALKRTAEGEFIAVKSYSVILEKLTKIKKQLDNIKLSSRDNDNISKINPMLERLNNELEYLAGLRDALHASLLDKLGEDKKRKF